MICFEVEFLEFCVGGLARVKIQKTPILPNENPPPVRLIFQTEQNAYFVKLENFPWLAILCHINKAMVLVEI